MKLKAENGKVTFQIKTGNDFVQNTMSESAARELIKNGEVTESDRPDFPICVNGNMYFPGEEEVVLDPTPARKPNRYKEGK